jgi:hypothetical protein
MVDHYPCFVGDNGLFVETSMARDGGYMGKRAGAAWVLGMRELAQRGIVEVGKCVSNA